VLSKPTLPASVGFSPDSMDVVVLAHEYVSIFHVPKVLKLLPAWTSSASMNGPETQEAFPLKENSMLI
jgi:hypothetical protein